MKNIGEPSRMEYQTLFLNQLNSFMARIRWRAWHILNPSSKDVKETYGFNTTKAPPSDIAELKLFEENMIKLASKLKFKKRTNGFQMKLKEDIRSLKEEPKLIIAADKTRNFYKTEVADYRTLLKRNVEKECKRGPDDLIDTFNKEDKTVAEELDIKDRMIHQTQMQTAFITMKDHKDNFLNNPKCRLVNPCKSELGRISKKIVEKIVMNVKQKSGLNLWKNTHAVIDWYKGLQNKERYCFIQFDINSFYPNISKKLVINALKFARKFTAISKQEEKIIIQSCRSVLVSDGKIWEAKGEESKFAVTIGSYSGAEVCELAGLYLLSQITSDTSIPKDLIGLYRDDGLMATTARACVVENLKKKLCEIFTKNDLSLDAKANRKEVDFLDVHFDLHNGKFKPYIKQNDKPQYVHAKSDHPPVLLKNIPPNVQKRLSAISSSKEEFDAAAPTYQEALRKAGHDYTLEYDEEAGSNNNNNNRRRQRKRNLTYFNPPYSMIVQTNVGKEFLKILDTSFPPGNKLHGKLNRHNVKLSYCCMPNMKRRIDRHNIQKLASGEEEVVERCNCTHFECPVNGLCGKKNCIYHATVESSDGATESYVGSTSQTFKKRYYKHRSSFSNQKYEHDTELSKYIWKLKRDNKTYRVRWRIIDRASPYNPVTKRCNLCNKERFYIMYKRNMATLNKRNEVYTVCRHRLTTLLSKS